MMEIPFAITKRLMMPLSNMSALVICLTPAEQGGGGDFY
jgi:hypothetical protein